MLVKEYITPNPVTIRPESDFLAAIAILKAARFHSLPVVTDSGELVGIVTDRDLAAASPPAVGQLKPREPDFFGVKLTVRQVMNPEFVTVEPDIPLEEAAMLMLRERVDRLLIIDGDRLVGIITYTDIFRQLVTILGGGSPTIRITVEVVNVPGQLGAVADSIASAGGNIVSVATAKSTAERVALTLRVEGVDWRTLKQALVGHGGIKILHVCGEHGACLE